MSACTLLAADVPLETGRRPGLYMDVYPYIDAYTERQYGVWLDIEDDRGPESLLEYLAGLLRRTDSAELWRVWVGNEYCWDLDFDERPVIRRRSSSAGELSAADLCELCNADVFLRGSRRAVFNTVYITR